MSYRPIMKTWFCEDVMSDEWFLARAKLKEDPEEPDIRQEYYGAYPGGFLERARHEVCAGPDSAVLHVCGGKARLYPYSGFGEKDRTLDLDPKLKPDFLQDARKPYPFRNVNLSRSGSVTRGWDAVLADPPYTEEDAEKYAPGKSVFPSANLILRNSLDVVKPGGCVGILHYLLPAPPKEKNCGYVVKFVAAIAVYVGHNNRIRCFSVFRREK